MDEIKLRKDENGDGAFYILKGEEQLGEMVFSVAGPMLTVHHTVRRWLINTLPVIVDNKFGQFILI